MTETIGGAMDVSVPVHIQPFKATIRKQYTQAIKELKVKRVFLAASIHNGHLPDLEVVRAEAAVLQASMESYRNSGIEVAYWGNTIGHGGSLLEGVSHRFQEIVGPTGKAAPGVYCPLDESFRQHVGQSYGIIAGSGVDLLMLDDDFRLHLHAPEAPVGCFCPLHMEAVHQRIGWEISREQLAEEVLHGAPSPLRSQWLEVMGDSLLELAGEIERAVHAVNPQARLGLCAVMSHWGHEGVTMEQLLSRLAGGTRPLLRTIGAPYWSKEPHNVGWIIEYTRLQTHWLRNVDVEIMAEGDTYPQSRFHCPAATLHAFNQGLRAAGIPGILNYGLHFSLTPRLESGYMDVLLEQREHYAAISEFCPTDYESRGITPIVIPYNFAHMTLPDAGQDTHYSWPDEPVALHYLSRLGLPVSHMDSQGPVLLNGTMASNMSDSELDVLLNRGTIIDGVAATWLMERGIDIGFSSFRPAKTPVFERFLDEETCGTYAGEYMWSIGFGPSGFYQGDPRPDATIISEFLGLQLKPLFPGVIHYENAKGQRFCILPFDLQNARYSKQLMYNYARQEQLAASFAWVNKNALPATLLHQPDVHLLCNVSPNEDRLVIILQNLSLDKISNPVIRLSPNISISGTIEWLQNDCRRSESTSVYDYHNDKRFGYLRLETIMPPMGFMAIAINSPWG